MKNVMTWRAWHDVGGFTDENAAKQALRFAQQLWLDGIGDVSQQEWLGLNDEEMRAWMRKHEIPRPKRGYRGSLS